MSTEDPKMKYWKGWERIVSGMRKLEVLAEQASAAEKGQHVAKPVVEVFCSGADAPLSMAGLYSAPPDYWSTNVYPSHMMASSGYEPPADNAMKLAAMLERHRRYEKKSIEQEPEPLEFKRKFSFAKE